MLKLIVKAEKEGIKLLEDQRIGRLKGLYVDGHIVLNPNVKTETERRCILAEELGHYYTSYGDIIDQSKVENRKQELRARAWAYEKLISPQHIISAFNYGVQNYFELAEFLNVTEQFAREAVAYFKTKYWPSLKTDKYCIIFDPLTVIQEEEEN